MNLEFIEKLFTTAGRGILCGFGVGGAAYGLFFLVLSEGQEEGLNIAALVAIFAGAFCVCLSLNLNKSN